VTICSAALFITATAILSLNLPKKDRQITVDYILYILFNSTGLITTTDEHTYISVMKTDFQN